MVGSANTDMVVRVPHLPARGETVLGGEFVSAGGGKGANQAIAARRLGAEVMLRRPARPRRPSATRSLAAFEAEGLCDRATSSATTTRPAGVALILVEAGGENMIAVAPGANGRLTPQDVEAALRRSPSAKVLVAQLEVPIDAVRPALAIARRCRRAGRSSTPRRCRRAAPRRDSTRSSTCSNPNRGEAAKLTGVDVVDRNSAEMPAGCCWTGASARSSSRSASEGALVVTETTQAAEVAGLPVDAVDTVGAGDAFTAGLAVALGSGESLERGGEATPTPSPRSRRRRVGAQPSLPTTAEVAAFLVPAAGVADDGDDVTVYQVRLPTFEGPLDLLLQLIERHQLDITTVSLALVTDQYIEHLRTGAGSTPSSSRSSSPSRRSCCSSSRWRCSRGRRRAEPERATRRPHRSDRAAPASTRRSSARPTSSRARRPTSAPTPTWRRRSAVHRPERPTPGTVGGVPLELFAPSGDQDRTGPSARPLSVTGLLAAFRRAAVRRRDDPVEMAREIWTVAEAIVWLLDSAWRRWRGQLPPSAAGLDRTRLVVRLPRPARAPPSGEATRQTGGALSDIELAPAGAEAEAQSGGAG